MFFRTFVTDRACPQIAPKGSLADYSATPETPVEGANALGEAGGVEKFNPPTAEPGAAASRNWADLSEDILSPVLPFGEAPTSADRAEGHLTDVKEELHQETSSSGGIMMV